VIRIEDPNALSVEQPAVAADVKAGMSKMMLNLQKRKEGKMEWNPDAFEEGESSLNPSQTFKYSNTSGIFYIYLLGIYLRMPQQHQGRTQSWPPPFGGPLLLPWPNK
jgi:hypothetical protein